MGLLLLCLALIPLSGAVWFSANRLGEIQSARANAEATDADAQLLVDLTILRARLLDERNWAAASRGVSDIGLDASVAEQFIGINLDEQWQLAGEGVDQLIDKLELEDLRGAVADIRTNQDLPLQELADRYHTAEEPVAAEASRLLDAMLETSGDIRGSEEIIRSVRVLEATASARQATASQLTHFFGLQLSTSDDNADLRDLISEVEQYKSSVTDIRRIAEPGSVTLQSLDDAQAAEEFTRLQGAMDRMIQRNLDTAAGGSGSLQFDLSAVSELTALFNDGLFVSSSHLDLVAVASSEVLDASATVQSDAENRSRQNIASIAVVAAASLAFALALSSVIGRPMRRLARAAERLRDGKSVRHIKPAGPSELRAATRAISEAAAHLELAERQATALAQGDLDHPALGDNAPGTLGKSLQAAVQTLATSINDSNDFRERLEHEVQHDGLTQLPNRKACLAALDAHLQECRDNGSTMATMFVDLDGFKETNDTYGHLFGDQVLRVIAQRLDQAAAGNDAVVGRFGGDEFLVNIRPADDIAHVVSVAEAMRASISEPIAIGPNHVEVGASIGIAFANTERHQSADDLLWEADLAVYQAKLGGRGRVEVCDDALRARVEAQGKMAERIVDAIRQNDLMLYFQPIVRSTDGSVHNMEALVRWNASDEHVIYPDEFIPVAEASDLIIDLDRWVINQATMQLAEWATDPVFADLEVSINVSSRHLSSDRFVENIMGPIRMNGVDPSRVVIEVTESALLEDRIEAAKKLEQLRSHGVLVAIDDFGTGYTSLGHLRDLPVDILKIDRSFTDPASGSQSLVKLIVDAGHVLGARITAEGVETEEQAQWLAEMGADDLQGYLFARPCPPDDLNIRRARQKAVSTLDPTASAVS